MNSFSRNFDTQRIVIMNIEMQLRKHYQRISLQVKMAVDSWLDKKTSPYRDLRK